MVLSIEQVNKSFGANVVLQDITAKIEDNDRIGLIGVNGAGKLLTVQRLGFYAKTAVCPARIQFGKKCAVSFSRFWRWNSGCGG